MAYTSLIEGFKLDCANLLKAFAQTGKDDYDTFIKIWQKMKFSLIYCNRTLTQLKIFSPHILLVVKSYMAAADYKTLGPFYLLYGLYYKQPSNVALIRMTIEEMKQLIHLTEDYASRGYYVPAYMLAKLQSDKAFFYTSDSQVFAMDYNFEKYFNNADDYNSRFEIPKPCLQTDEFVRSSIINSEWYAKWKEIEDEYNTIKAEELQEVEENETKKRKTKSASHHTLAPTNLLEEFKVSNITADTREQEKHKSDLDSIEENETKKRKTKSASHHTLAPTNLLEEFKVSNITADTREQEKHKSDLDSNSVGQLREKLKRKAFAGPVIFNKYDKKDSGNETVGVTEASSSTPPGTTSEDVQKKKIIGQWKHFVKCAINKQE